MALSLSLCPSLSLSLFPFFSSCRMDSAISILGPSGACTAPAIEYKKKLYTIRVYACVSVRRVQTSRSFARSPARPCHGRGVSTHQDDRSSAFLFPRAHLTGSLYSCNRHTRLLPDLGQVRTHRARMIEKNRRARPREDMCSLAGAENWNAQI